jgi:hypothetical protein
MASGELPGIRGPNRSAFRQFRMKDGSELFSEVGPNRFEFPAPRPVL